MVYDGLASVRPLGASFKHRVQVKFIDQQGREEKGIDAGGPFKEFLETVLKEAFNPAYGLFSQISNGDLCVAPVWQAIPNYLNTLEFLGMMVGKALYDNILIEAPFAQVFLNGLLDVSSDLHDLQVLEPVIYNSLLLLKTYEGDLKDLCLYFCVDEDVFGEIREIPLKPNGENIMVTQDNLIEYIYKTADFYLYRKYRAQIEAFKKGLRTLVNPDWLKMFNTQELRVLLAGDMGAIDMKDWQEHTVLENCFSHSTSIRNFWKVVAEFTPNDQRALLRFASGVSRPPLLGFRNLNPPFKIRLVPLASSGSSVLSFFKFNKNNLSRDQQLPMAATCFNTLKLPDYTSKKIMKEKLLLAIHSSSGFELS